MVFQTTRDATYRFEPMPALPPGRDGHLPDEALGKIAQAALDVIDDVGVVFHLEAALDLLEAAGARVDRDRHRVRLTPELVRGSIGAAPRRFVMGSRDREVLDLVLDGRHIYAGPEGTGTLMVDPVDSAQIPRVPRPSTKQDVALMARVCDSLPGIGFYWPMVSARDVPPAVMALHELEASFTHTEKHVHIVSCTDGPTARRAVAMARAIAGSEDRLRRRPPLSLIYCPTSPLVQERNSLEAALIFAAAGLPVVVTTMPIIGSTGPASMAGTMVQGCAEILSAACLLQLAHPGAPMVFCLFHDMLNPFTGGCVPAAPTKPRLQAAAVDLGHFFDLPVLSSYGSTGTRRPDTWQTGRDHAVDALYVCSRGPELLTCMGSLDAYTVVYPELILMEEDLFRSLKIMRRGMELDPAALALDEIRAVGPGGHYLDRGYTAENLRRLWHGGLCHQWSERVEAFREPHAVALERLHAIQADYHPPPLDPGCRRELAAIVAAAERECGVG